MAFKFVALFALVAVASAQYHHNDYYHQEPQYQQYHQAPAVIKAYQPAVVKQVVQPALIKKIVQHEEPANYEFNYDVHDPHTGDIKQQHEVAKDGAISGQYSLIDADGYRRIVDYTADDHHGFNAQVRREPVEGHKVVAQPIIKKIVAQPAIAVQKYVAPVQHQYVQAAPQYHQYQAAPVQHHYQAPAQVKVVAPVVQKYVAPVVQKYVAPVQHQYVQAAPVQHQYVHSAPAHQYVQAAPVVQKYVQAAPQYQAYAAPAKVVAKVEQHGTPYTHVSFSGPSSNYHY